jgi:hypothetical protein
MIWFFEKHRATLRYEIRRANDGHNYELVITYPDRRQRVETFNDAQVLQARAQQLHRSLAEAGWQVPRSAAD